MSSTHPTQEIYPQGSPHERSRDGTDLVSRALFAAAAVVVLAAAALVGIALASMLQPDPQTVVENAEAPEVPEVIAPPIDPAQAPPPQVVGGEIEAADNTSAEPTPVLVATPSPIPTATPAPAVVPAGGDATGDQGIVDDDSIPLGEIPDDGPAQPIPEGSDPQVDPQDSVDLGGGDSVPVEPHPCDEVLARGEVLLVEDPVVIPDGALSSEVTILNCGDSITDWTAATKPWVVLSDEAGDLAPGATTELGFTVPADRVDVGAFEFRIKVGEPTGQTYVEVYGFRKTIASIDFSGPGLLSPGEDAMGCGNNCIRRAELVSNATSANVTLYVETTVPAMVNVWVSTNAPVADGEGEPSLPGEGLDAFSPGFITEWNSPIGNLAPATRYHIVVEAIDENGNRTVEAGEFKSVTPVQTPGEFTNPAPAGCAQQCITQAQISFGGDPTGISLDVETTIAAFTNVTLSTQAPVYSGDSPEFITVAASASSGGYVSQWAGGINGLEYGTTYHVIVKATDEQGNTAHQLGEFSTQPDPALSATFDVLVVPLQTRIINDGDAVGRGELSFTWNANGPHATPVDGSRDMERMGDGETWNFRRPELYLFEDLAADSFLPQFSIVGEERDFDIDIPATFGGAPFRDPLKDRDTNGEDYWWSRATAGLNFVGNADSMPRCSQFIANSVWADHPCVEIRTIEHGDDRYPQFSAVIAFQISEDL